MQLDTDLSYALIQLLNDGQLYTSHDLSQRLNIGHAAIEEQIYQLIQFGVKIKRSDSQYKLTEPIILLDKNQIQAYVTHLGAFAIGSIEIFRNISSTNDYLKSQEFNLPNHLHFCLAEHQSAGRGQLNRTWHSPFGANIYLSCCWITDKPMSKFNGLSLAMGLAVVQALSVYNINQGLMIKWPNDIYWQEKKLAGILIEINALNSEYNKFILGIGLNVNMPIPVLTQIGQPSTSLNLILNGLQDRNKIAGLLINSISQFIEFFINKGFQYFLNDWKRYDYLANKKIQLQLNEKTVSGTMMGVDEKGYLLLKNTENNITSYSTGKVSLIKNN